MLNNLNNTNGKGSNAVVNKQIKDLQEAVSQLQTDVDQQEIDIASIESVLDEKASKSEIAAEVDTASLKANTVKVDTIESKDNESIQVNDDVAVAGNLSAGEASFTKVSVNGVDIVDDYTQKTSCAINVADHAEEIARDFAGKVNNLSCDLECYKTDNENCFETKNLTVETVTSTCSTCSKTLTVTECADLPDTTIQTIRNGTKLLSRFFEPTVKDVDDYYHIKLPGDFIGSASFVGIDEFDKVAFSAEIITRSDELSEGTTLIVHSGKSIYDFYQVLRDLETKRVSFITRSNVKRIYFSYDNYDKDAEPTYDIYPELSNFPYGDYESLYTAKHSSQTVVLGNENTLNGGMTVVGVLTAAIDSSGQPMITDNIFIKGHIFAGYNSDTGSYESQGKQGDILTMNNCSTTGTCTSVQRLNWITGCPRQLARKGVCLCKDSQNRECSDLQFESPTDNAVYGTNLSNTSDAIITERSVANWSGIAEDNATPTNVSYPITHLGNRTCVHGCMDVATDLCVHAIADIDADLNVHDQAHIHCLYVETDACLYHNLNVDTRIEACGDIRAKGNLISEGDAIVHGDLYVNGKVTSTEERQVTTSGNYIVAREGAANGLTSTEYAGLVVNNYDGNGCNATILADCSGEFRVADQAYTTCTTYTDISEWGGCFYCGLTTTATTGPTHILSDVSAVELSNVVFNPTAGTSICADSYYHFEGTEWFGPLSIVSGHFDLGNPVDGVADVAALNALTRDKLIYYNTVTDNEISGVDQNQPILTRNEAGNMSQSDLLCWDASNRRADSIGSGPTLSNQTLVSCIDNQNKIHYQWETKQTGVVAFCGTYACLQAALLIPEGQPGYIPANSQVIVTDCDNVVYSLNC